MGKRIFTSRKNEIPAHFLSLELQKSNTSWSGWGGAKALHGSSNRLWQILLNAHLGIWRRILQTSWSRTKPARHHGFGPSKNCKDHIETIQRFAVSYIYKPVLLRIWSSYFSDFPRSGLVDQHCSQMKFNVLSQSAYGWASPFIVARRWLLWRREYDLLATLGKQESSDSWELLESVGSESATETNIVDVYIRYLRSKLDVKGQKSYIKTVRGVGYTMQE